jgi:hypothetical protein
MPTRSQMVATQRALSGLARAGLVYRVSGRPTRWTANRDRHLADQLRCRHYLRSVPTRPVMYFGHDGAVVCFAVPANPQISRHLLGKPNAVAELARLYAPDGHAPNLLTETLSLALAELRRRHPGYEAVVSYADPEAGHSGGVYRAASWIALGQSDEHRPNGRHRKARQEPDRIGKLRFARGLTRSARRLIAEHRPGRSAGSG